MRLAYVYDCIHPWETGGVQTRVFELARRLAENHDVHWYGLHYWEGPPVIEHEGMTLHGVAQPQDLYVGGRRSIREALSFSSRLLWPLVGEEFDVIDCQSFPYFPILTSRIATMVEETALCVTWHEVWRDYWYEYLGRKGAIGKGIEWLCGRVPDEHVAVSRRTRRDLETLGVNTAEVVPNGIDIAEMNDVTPAEDAVDVIFAGRLIKEKNPDLLLRAIAKCVSSRREMRCRIVGEGPERDRINRLVSEYNLDANVTVTGFLDERADLLGLLKAADVFALPSRREGFGITALEALACGTPVATINHEQNAAVELVKDGETGVITAPEAGAFAQGLRRAEQLDPAACRDAAKRYDWDKLTEEMQSVYASVAQIN